MRCGAIVAVGSDGLEDMFYYGTKKSRDVPELN